MIMRKESTGRYVKIAVDRTTTNLIRRIFRAYLPAVRE